MRYLAALALFASALAAPAQGKDSTAQGAVDLRTAIKQVNDRASAGSTRPRQLSPQERAQLRRQLSEHGRRAP